MPAFDIFGEYYILNPSEGKKPTKCTGEDAIAKLSLKPQEISENCMNLLINVSMKYSGVDNFRELHLRKQ